MKDLGSPRVAFSPSRWALVVLLLTLPLSNARAGAGVQGQTAPSLEPSMVDPPTGVPAALRVRMSAAREGIESDRYSTNDLLAGPEWAELRPYTEFRELIRAHARQAKAVLAPLGEPGERLVVVLRVVDGSKEPRAGVLVYAYQTSAKGWYAAEAPHYGGIAGDMKHARLFGYCRTDSAGKVELGTIRPGGYPRSTLPQHIHVALEGEPGESAGGEILFDDDPRLTPEERRHGGNVVAVVTRQDGVQSCQVEFVLERAKAR